MEYNPDRIELGWFEIPANAGNVLLRAIAAVREGFADAYTVNEEVVQENGTKKYVTFGIETHAENGRVYFSRIKRPSEKLTEEEQRKRFQISSQEAKEKRLKDEEKVADALGVDVETYRQKLKEHRGW